MTTKEEVIAEMEHILSLLEQHPEIDDYSTRLKVQYASHSLLLLKLMRGEACV